MSVIVVMGGAGDIGHACARLLHEDGHTVEVGDLRADPAAVQPWRSTVVDTADRPGLDGYIAAVAARHGRLDALVCAQGIVRNEDVLDLTDEAWDATLAVNLTGAMASARAAARRMADQEEGPDGLRGRIVFIGSWVSVAPWPGSSAYSVSKAGLRTLSAAIALELAEHRIVSNVVEPGIVEAGLSAELMRQDPSFRADAERAIPLGRLQDSSSVASAVRYLCDASSAYMTGAVLRIDGGARLTHGS